MSALSNRKIAFIGAGKMAEAILAGILAVGLAKASEITISDKRKARIAFLCRKYKVKRSPNNVAAVLTSDIVMFCVKPQVMLDILLELSPWANRKHIIISIAAGISLDTIEKSLKNSRIIRVMPNSPCLIRAGMSAIAPGKKAKAQDLEIAKSIFSALGEIVILSEKCLDAVTGLSGSGPAYFYRMVDALASGGKKAGLPYNTALKLATQTMLGAALMLQKTKKWPEDLVHMVATPKGTTVEGLAIMDEGKVKQVLSLAVVAAARRAGELRRKYK